MSDTACVPEWGGHETSGVLFRSDELTASGTTHALTGGEKTQNVNTHLTLCVVQFSSFGVYIAVSMNAVAWQPHMRGLLANVAAPFDSWLLLLVQDGASCLQVFSMVSSRYCRIRLGCFKGSGEDESSHECNLISVHRFDIHFLSISPFWKFEVVTIPCRMLEWCPPPKCDFLGK